MSARIANAFAKTRSAEAVVVGGGPSGLAVVGTLLHHLAPDRRRLSWADPRFRAGRIHERYREVPSNTRVDLFAKFATAVAPLQRVVDSTPAPNAFTALGRLPQDQGCSLSYAADLCLMLTDGLAREFPSVAQHRGKVTNATLDKHTSTWTVALDESDHVTTRRLILCTGSSPISETLPILQQGPLSGHPIAPVHLDTALKPSLLAQQLDSQAAVTIAVVGASHSAILVLMNLCNLATTSHPKLRIKWFTRHKNLRYAEHKDGWILYDNTGLKGQAAQWARQNLEDETFPSSQYSSIITRLWTQPGNGEESIYQAELLDCTHIVQAIGYQRDPIPELSLHDSKNAEPQSLRVDYDNDTGRFWDASRDQTTTVERKHVPGLFGAGIAFPERVKDPAGNVEQAVGLWKFMNFTRKAVPQWLDSTKE
ncbi:hypothetical protein AK830_g9046 [Neonectria ditissima]|uniref:FAD-dependent urate hydroxylase HpyO/Asp monooxygenase CreE-like FAD/NAD(P)-binding domain-containing protein n=1 Tax=Neonectria ditissima TaxID=78410 RepID=A0A0N8H5Y9_9HYPO|nr:hypothetical protein AK830_g9046 [Neonectria ditissima]